MGRSVRFSCHECGSIGDIVTSRRITSEYKEVWLRCRNTQCDEKWKEQISLVKIIRPSLLKAEISDSANPAP